MSLVGSKGLKYVGVCSVQQMEDLARSYGISNLPISIYDLDCQWVRTSCGDLVKVEVMQDFCAVRDNRR